MLRGNKGEWSEIYAFCYILSSGILQAADKDLNPMTDIYFPVVKIIREETEGEKLEYRPEEKIKLYRSGKLIGEYKKEEFDGAVETMLRKIPEGTAGTFEIPELTSFFDDIKVSKLKADSNHKQDIDIQIHDINTGIAPICGFSIKSYLGSNPTLINAGNGTNFIYRIENCSNAVMNSVNLISSRRKIIERMSELRRNGCNLVFEKVLSSQFDENMQFVDSRMPEIMGHLLMISYRDDIKDLPSAVKKMSEENPLGFRNINMYAYKVKKLLSACALGMTPEKKWEGAEDANGGYIVVKHDGSVVCYYIYNRPDFEQYLFDYTYFERPGTDRYNYANVYKDGEQYRCMLNLQVRFKKQ